MAPLTRNQDRLQRILVSYFKPTQFSRGVTQKILMFCNRGTKEGSQKNEKGLNRPREMKAHFDCTVVRLLFHLLPQSYTVFLSPCCPLCRSAGPVVRMVTLAMLLRPEEGKK